jgi:hypothetical protein
MNATKRRRTRGAPQQQNGERLLAILESNRERTRDPALRGRLQAAIKALKERDDARAA